MSTKYEYTHLEGTPKESVDWTSCSPAVKNQGKCRTAQVFSVTAAVEGLYCKENDKTMEAFSELVYLHDEMNSDCDLDTKTREDVFDFYKENSPQPAESFPYTIDSDFMPEVDLDFQSIARETIYKIAGYKYVEP